MITEGKGRVAPKPIPVKLTRVECSIVKRLAEKQAEYRGYKDKDNRWSNGLVAGTCDRTAGELTRAVRPIHCGMLGEYALCKIIGRRACVSVSPDFRPRRTGDHGIDIDGLVSIQVKTRQRERGYSQVRLDYREFIPVLRVCDVHAFCEWQGGGDVLLLGWLWTRELVGLDIVSGVGDWRNVEPKDSDLRPICRLIDELRSRKAR